MSKRKRGATAVLAKEEIEQTNLSDATTAATNAAAAASSSSSIASASSSKTAKPSKPHPSAARYASTSHWLMKNEPPFSLAALQLLPNQTEPWVGVRNHEARNMMQHGMQSGHQVLYYNASITNPHIAGIATVATQCAYPDSTAWDAASCYYDTKTDPKKPTWMMIDVKFKREFKRPVYLAEMKLHATTTTATTADSSAIAAASSAASSPPLAEFSLFTRPRLSIHPLTLEQFNFLCNLELTPLPASVILKPEKKKQKISAQATANTNDSSASAAASSSSSTVAATSIAAGRSNKRKKV